jgi:hypothetical protein
MSRVFVCVFESTELIKKVGNSALVATGSFEWFDGRWEQKEGWRSLCEMIAPLEALIPDLGLDLGTIDIVADDDDRPSVIDVNSTPAYKHEVPGLVEFLRDSGKSRGP